MITESRFQEIIGKFRFLDPLLVVGDVGVDKYTLGEVNRISPEAPVPILEVKKEWYKLGLAANVSDNLQGLEVKSTLCGVVGADRNGDIFDTLLEEKQLKTWGIVREEDRPTTYKERVTTAIQQICRVDYETRQDISPQTEHKVFDRIMDFAKDHSAVILEDYGKGLFTKELIQELIKELQQQNKLVAVDPAQWTPPHFYQKATLLTPNRNEAQTMVQDFGYQSTTIEEQATILLDKLNLESVIITLGSEGMAFMNRDKGTFQAIPTVASEVFDVSGAGDTAISAMVSALVCGASLMEATWIGNCASGVVVGKKGTARVSQSELMEFFKQAQKKYNDLSL